MTAIAAIRVEGVPALIGDLLLSSKSAPAPTVNLPLLGEIPSRFPVDGKKYVSGLRQKICILNQDLAIAWSGDHCDAADILISAREHFQSHLVSGETLRHFFGTYALRKGSFPASLALVCAFHDRAKGWLDTLPVRALGHEHIVSFQSPRYGWCELAGSGALEIKKQLMAERDQESIFGDMNIGAKVFAEALSIGNRLLMQELITGASIAMHFGGGYETCIFQTTAFSKPSGILNLYWEHHKSVGPDRFRLIWPITRISYVDDILLIRCIDTRTFSRTGVVVTQYLVEPADRNVTSFERGTAQTDWGAPFVSHTVIVRKKGRQLGLGQFVDARKPPSVTIREEHGRIELLMNKDWMQSCLTSIKRQAEFL